METGADFPYTNDKSRTEGRSTKDAHHLRRSIDSRVRWGRGVNPRGSDASLVPILCDLSGNSHGVDRSDMTQRFKRKRGGHRIIVTKTVLFVIRSSLLDLHVETDGLSGFAQDR